LQTPPQRCKSGPTSQGRHSCSSSSPDLRQACTPSPCRGSGHLGRHKTAVGRGREKVKVSEQMERKLTKCLKLHEDSATMS
uniref:Uncharacterized protein n=1 Tax=Esox lucius TaxID=8010 RepID=A0A3P8Z753_ESOLU